MLLYRMKVIEQCASVIHTVQWIPFLYTKLYDNLLCKYIVLHDIYSNS